jgi:hypothetical protein
MNEAPSYGSGRGFYVAPFAPDGELIDVGFWTADALSEAWLNVCESFVAKHADSQIHSWGHELGHVSSRLTASSGAALVTFYVNQQIVLSSALLSGNDPGAEASLADLFVESLRRTPLVQAAAGSSANMAFDAVRSLRQRPLAAVVVWHPDNATDEDMELVRELALHLAWVYFLREGTDPQPR